MLCWQAGLCWARQLLALTRCLHAVLWLLQVQHVRHRPTPAEPWVVVDFADSRDLQAALQVCSRQALVRHHLAQHKGYACCTSLSPPPICLTMPNHPQPCMVCASHVHALFCGSFCLQAPPGAITLAGRSLVLHSAAHAPDSWQPGGLTTAGCEGGGSAPLPIISVARCHRRLAHTRGPAWQDGTVTEAAANANREHACVGSTVHASGDHGSPASVTPHHRSLHAFSQCLLPWIPCACRCSSPKAPQGI